jgi:hypothetical protein
MNAIESLGMDQGGMRGDIGISKHSKQASKQALSKFRILLILSNIANE